MISFMNTTTKKRRCKSQGGCTANGASRPTGDRFNNKGSLQWAKDFLAHYEGGIEAHPELVDSRDYWCASYFVTMDKLIATQVELNKALSNLNERMKKFNRMGEMYEDAKCELAYERERVRLLRIALGKDTLDDDMDELDFGNMDELVE